MLLGVISRGVLFWKIPGGINNDEAFGAYEAYALLNFGTDSAGYHFPVYLETWGSGMSALNSYLMLPFMAVIGKKILAVRLPSFITACASLFAAHSLIKRMINERAALIVLLMLAISPYHYMISRWSMDCNLAPGLLLIGFYFFIRGAEESKFYIISAVFYGLSLYAYITVLPYVPVLILIMLIYLAVTRKLKIDKYGIIAALVLFVTALPLMLFMAVNYGVIKPVNTAFISIPALSAMRGAEVSFEAPLWNLKKTIMLLVTQSDGVYSNAADKYGMYYKLIPIFSVAGIIYCAVKLIKSIIKREYDAAAMLLFPFGVSLLQGSIIINVNINRINSIHIPMIIFIGLGIYLFLNYVNQYFKYAYALGGAVLLFVFALFLRFYFTEYRINIANINNEGLEEAIEYAEELYLSEKTAPGTRIYTTRYAANYSKLLFYTGMPPAEYLATKVYQEDGQVKTLGHYEYVDDTEGIYGNICITYAENEEKCREMGYTTKVFDTVLVAYRQNA